tara:strand:- start:653 stop:1513 length:861 start_codon:yes stop_codon:yes gene_type:complete
VIYRIGDINQKYLMSNTNQKVFNKFVVDFLKQNQDCENIVNVWNSKKVQGDLKSILNKDVTKTQKDPNAPKKPKSSYLCFCEVNRKKVQQDLGADTKVTEITKELGNRWNALKENPKKATELKKYEKMAGEDRARYEDEMSSYVPTEEFVKPVKTGPKRAKSGYLFFCDANREKVQKSLGKDAKATEITKQLGALWNEAKASNSIAKYEKLAKSDKERYESEKKTTTVKVSNSSDSGYQNFCDGRRSELKEEHPKLKAVEITKMLATQWKNMDEDEKQEFSTGVLA